MSANSFMITGTVAREMFDSMAPDSKDRCSLEHGYRERNKKNVSCVLDRDVYACHFGFKLRSGKSIAGVICQLACRLSPVAWASGVDMQASLIVP